MRLRATFAAVVAALAAVLVIAPATPAAPISGASLTAPITGTIDGGGTFTGAFTLDRIISQNGGLAAVGTLTGTISGAVAHNGPITPQQITVPLTPSGTCQILHLDLGPLDLDLLGLRVHLNEVVLDITAQSGPGNLLGNLLCGVAHLLDGSAGGGTLANVLNRLLGL